MHSQQCLRHARTTTRWKLIRDVQLEALRDNATRERVAVGVQTVAGECDQYIATPNEIRPKHATFLDDADYETRQVVIGRSIDARHLRCFAADQRTAVL